MKSQEHAFEAIFWIILIQKVLRPYLGLELALALPSE